MYGKKSWRSYSSGVLTLLTNQSLDFYSKLTDGSVVNVGYPNESIQLEYLFVYTKKLFCNGYLNFAFLQKPVIKRVVSQTYKKSS